jgi:hypothetical protein
MVMSGHITRLKGRSMFIYILRVGRKQYGHEWPYNHAEGRQNIDLYIKGDEEAVWS